MSISWSDNYPRDPVFQHIARHEVHCAVGVCAHSLSQAVCLSLVGNEKWHRCGQRRAQICSSLPEGVLLWDSLQQASSQPCSPWPELTASLLYLRRFSLFPHCLSSPALGADLPTVWVLQHGKGFSDATSSSISLQADFLSEASPPGRAENCILPIICTTQQREMLLSNTRLKRSSSSI